MEREIHSIPVLGIRGKKPIEYYIDDNGCHICISHGKSNAYPPITLPGTATSIPVTRYLWETTNGKIKDGLFACHYCDTPRCINLNHIFLGTHTDNMKDMVTKGRHLKKNIDGGAKPKPKDGTVVITVKIDPETADALKMLARKDRRSTQNLVNKVLAEWCEGMKGVKSIPGYNEWKGSVDQFNREQKGGENNE